MRIELWTDGSCFPNPGGAGGWCAIILARREDVEYSEMMDGLKVVASLPPKVQTIKNEDKPLRWKAKVIRGGVNAAELNTNNRMELQAIIEGLVAMKPCSLTIVTDSMYAIGVLSGKKQAHVNRDLVSEWRALSQGFNVEWKHIEGHGTGTPNVIADLIAGSEANERRTEE